jgi:4-hydroxybenzoate polyprenyltransferase
VGGEEGKAVLSQLWWIFLSLRPVQWIKNGFLLIPLVFARKAFDPDSLLQSASALVIFCLTAGAIYLVNDLSDLEADRKHPTKRFRPLAAGHISPFAGKVTAILLLLVSLVWASSLNTGFFIALVVYVTIQLLYSYRLKEVVILDIFCVSAGFFLRVVAGALAIQVEISSWLIICTVLISMFLSVAKRRNELILFGEIQAGGHRKVLERYSLELFDQMISVIMACTLLSYMLYCVSRQTIEKFGSDRMIYSSPFVLYGVFRYLYLIHKENKGGAPERVLLTDAPLLIDVVLWAIVCMLVIYGII